MMECGVKMSGPSTQIFTVHFSDNMVEAKYEY